MSRETDTEASYCAAVYATWMVAASADPKSVQSRMRHASLAPTLGIYAHVVTEAQRKAVNRLMADMDQQTKNPATPKVVPIAPQLEHFGT